MATTPPPTPPAPGPDDQFKKFFVRMGFNWDRIDPQRVQTALTPLGQAVRNFSQSTEFQKSWFAHLPKVRGLLDAIQPSTLRFTRSLIAMGVASRQGVDGGEMYNSLGLFSKGLVTLVDKFGLTGQAATLFGRTVQMALSAATLGIALLISAAVELGQAFANLVMMGFKYQEALNDVSKLMGGAAWSSMKLFNDQMMSNMRNLSGYGFAFQKLFATAKAFIAEGLPGLRATNQTLLETTEVLSVLTGQEGKEFVGFFSNVIKGSKVTDDSLKKMVGSFMLFNQKVAMTGQLGAISFEKYKEAIESASTSLLIASNKGSKAVNQMSSDLAALAGMASTLNINISELNRGFEESASLINSASSGFRALLAISGGANITNMLTNQFNRTEAMLKTADTLRNLNAQFGNNLNILGEVASGTFGLAKETAIKLASMSQEQRKALSDAAKFSEALQDSAFKKGWERSINTVGQAWDRLKNMFINSIQRAFSSNTAFQQLLNKITSALNRWVTEIGNPNSIIGRITDKLSSVMTKFSTWLEKIWDNLEGYVDRFVSWLSNLLGEDGLLGNSDKKNEVLESFGESFAVGLMKGIMKGLWTVFKYTNPAGWLVSGIEWLLDDTTLKKKMEAQGQSILATFKAATNANLSALQREVSRLQKEQAKLDALKDTDIIINKKGEFTFAGMEKLQIETALEDSQKQLEKATSDNTIALTRLTTAINQAIGNKDTNSLDAAQRQVARQTGPMPPMFSPVGRPS